MKLTINLATRRYVNTRLLSVFLVGAIVILAGLLVLRVREIAYNQAELSGVRKLTAAAGNRPGSPVVSDAQLKEVQARIRFANSLIDRKAVNWLLLLDRMEEVVPNGVALTQIEPAKQEQMLSISGAASNFGALRSFLENMERSKNFSEVYLLSQSDTKVGLTQRGINFTVSCRVNYR